MQNLGLDKYEMYVKSHIYIIPYKSFVTLIFKGNKHQTLLFVCCVVDSKLKIDSCKESFCTFKNKSINILIFISIPMPQRKSSTEMHNFVGTIYLNGTNI